MEPFRLTPEELYRQFHTARQGLSAQSARERLLHFGSNEIGKKKNYLKAYGKQYLQFFTILLEEAAMSAFIAFLLPFPILLFLSHEAYKQRKRRAMRPLG